MIHFFSNFVTIAKIVILIDNIATNILILHYKKHITVLDYLVETNIQVYKQHFTLKKDNNATNFRPERASQGTKKQIPTNNENEKHIRKNSEMEPVK